MPKVWAQDEYSEDSTATATVAQGNYDDDVVVPPVAQGFEIGGTYFLGNNMGGKVSINGKEGALNVNDIALSQFALPAPGFKYAHVPYQGFGFTLAGRYELPRQLDQSWITQAGNVYGAFPPDSTLSAIVGEINMTYTVERGYFFLGPNYNIPVLFNLSDLDCSGNVGGQAGVGWGWNSTFLGLTSPKDFDFEIFFQSLNFKFRDLVRNSGDTDATWAGIALRLGIVF